jgi:beta-barrel assembly-enhancing protease
MTLVPASAVMAQRTRLKPGFNIFSAQQDVEVGQQAARDAEQKLTMLNNSKVDDYLNRLGKKLAASAPGEKYPYQFKCVNDASINAFALPGGFLFVNRGTIEAADNEAELAGVIGHEIGHVALRHGTNQASKSYGYQALLGLLGGVAGKNSTAALIKQLGGFGVNSVLLKYSRDDERQADLMGAQILYDTNYDPRNMATFFEKLGTGQRGLDFFSSHPNPDNRIKNINVEIDKLGARSSNYTGNDREFNQIKKLVKSLPPAPKAAPEGSSSVPSQTKPALPSRRMQQYDAQILSVQYPDNWQAYGKDQSFTLAPEGGIVRNGNAEALAYGVIMAVYATDSGNGTRLNLVDATNQLIENLQNSNQGMRVTKEQGQIRVGSQSALSKMLANDSPLGGRETDWLVTTLRPEGLVYFIFAAPEQDFNQYQLAFKQILNSVSFLRR